MDPRQLIIMRHATAGRSHGRDRDRPLTPQGLDEGRRVGLRLRRVGPIPERVLCSSALRCRETWLAVAVGLGAAPPSAPVVEFEDRLYNASASDLADAVAAVVDARVVLLVAHNPGVSQLALELGRRHEEDEGRLRSGFRPATIACFELAGGWSELSSRTARLSRFEPPPDEE
jgi:phosphohistidine phosphatase